MGTPPPPLSTGAAPAGVTVGPAPGYVMCGAAYGPMERGGVGVLSTFCRVFYFTRMHIGVA